MDALQSERRLSRLEERFGHAATKADLIVAAIIQATLSAIIAAVVTRIMV
ncbi:MAG: hypothetical protein OXF44_14095 [Anaerolineaceae bacterium]|nr:hypothetical protein [Anaerolineaceae bacterium]